MRQLFVLHMGSLVIIGGGFLLPPAPPPAPPHQATLLSRINPSWISRQILNAPIWIARRASISSSTSQRKHHRREIYGEPGRLDSSLSARCTSCSSPSILTPHFPSSFPLSHVENTAWRGSEMTSGFQRLLCLLKRIL